MKFAARAVAIVVMGSFLLSSGFAEDAAKASSDSTKHEATSDPNASVSATAAPEAGIPVAPQTKSKKASSSSSGEETAQSEYAAEFPVSTLTGCTTSVAATTLSAQTCRCRRDATLNVASM